MGKLVSSLFMLIILASVVIVMANQSVVRAAAVNPLTMSQVAGNLGQSDFIVDELTSTIYFAGQDGNHGVELWKTDGTAEGTVMVKDINPGTNSSIYGGVLNGAVVGQTLFFAADDGVHGTELWKTDGTEAGTVMVKNIWSVDERGSYPSGFTKCGSLVYFSANDRTHGEELWKTDGTSDGTVLVKNINTQQDSWMTDYDYGSKPKPVLSDGSYLYFLANDGVHGYELWRTDGTDLGTIMLKDIVQWDNSLDPGYEQFGKAFGKVVFTVNDPHWGTTELWITDGTTAGTILLKHFGTDDPITFMNQMADILLFFANDGVSGYELWRTDGTPTGTLIVEDVNPGSGGAVNLWFFDTLPYDYQQKFSFSLNWQLKTYFTPTDSNSNLYFVAEGTASYDQATQTWIPGNIWKTDGTYLGTRKVTNFGSGYEFAFPSDPTPLGGTLYYLWGGSELWKIEPGVAPSLVYNFTIPGEMDLGMGKVSLRVRIMTVFDNELVMVRVRPNLPGADSGYPELWISDGTTAGTHLLGVAGLGDSAAFVQGELFFLYSGGLFKLSPYSDIIPPTTNMDIGNPKYIDANGNVFVTSATPFMLSAEDNEGGSGVASTGYRVRNATYDSGWMTSTPPTEFCLSTLSDGNYFIDYKSTDNAGNVADSATQDIILDNSAPLLTFITPQPNEALQDGITFKVSASDQTGVASVTFSIKSPQGNTISSALESMPAVLGSDGNWNLYLNTQQLSDGFYSFIANATDILGNCGSTSVQFSIRNWATIQLLPSTPNSKAGRTMPIKFSIRVSADVDSTQPWIYNEELTIKIYKISSPSNILLQTSTFGSSSTDYRIETDKLYITNFKTLTIPATYLVNICREGIIIASFQFSTAK